MTVIYSKHLELIRIAHPDLAINSVSLRHGQFNHVLIINDRYVFRFPRTVQAARAMGREMVVLQAIANRLNLRVPNPVHSHIDPDTHVPLFTGYDLIPGEPFPGGFLARINDPRVVERLARQLAIFLRDLHAFPLDAIEYEIPIGELPSSWYAFYDQVQTELFPHMRREARENVNVHFADYLEDPDRYWFEPKLRHGDFGPGNILVDRGSRTVTGVIDFGSSGPGDPAQDIGALLVSYGQPFVERMYKYYPEMPTMLKRAAFYMGTYALQEALNGLRDGDPVAFEAGISRYR